MQQLALRSAPSAVPRPRPAAAPRAVARVAPPRRAAPARPSLAAAATGPKTLESAIIAPTPVKGEEVRGEGGGGVPAAPPRRGLGRLARRRPALCAHRHAHDACLPAMGSGSAETRLSPRMPPCRRRDAPPARRPHPILPRPPPQTEWYALVASAGFMLHDVQNEAFPEQLRERRRLFSDKGRAPDFFLVSQPAWLDAALGPRAASVARPAVALVSTDRVWITFMKLRLDRVLQCEVGRCAPAAALASAGPPPDFPPLDRAPGAGPWMAPYPPYKPGWWSVFMDYEGLV